MTRTNRSESLLDALDGLPAIVERVRAARDPARLLTDGGRPTEADHAASTDPTTDSPVEDGPGDVPLDPEDGDETATPDDGETTTPDENDEATTPDEDGEETTDEGPTDEDDSASSDDGDEGNDDTASPDEDTDDEDTDENDPEIVPEDGEDVFQFMTVRPPEATDLRAGATIDPKSSEGLVADLWGGGRKPTQKEAMERVRDHERGDEFVRKPSDLSLSYDALRDRLADAPADASFDDLVAETFGATPSDLVASPEFERDEGRLLDSLAAVSVHPAGASEETRETVRNGVRLADAIRRSADGERVSPDEALDRQVVLPDVIAPLPTLPADETDAPPGGTNGDSGGDPDGTDGDSGCDPSETDGDSNPDDSGADGGGVAGLAHRVRRLETARAELATLERDVASVGDEEEEESVSSDGEPSESTTDRGPLSRLLSTHGWLADEVGDSADEVAEQLSEIVDDTDRVVELLSDAKPRTATLNEDRYADLSAATRTALSEVGASPGTVSVSEATARVTEEATRLNARLLGATVGGYERLVETEDGPMLVNDATESSGSAASAFGSFDTSWVDWGGDFDFGNDYDFPMPRFDFGDDDDEGDEKAGVTPLGFGDLRVVKQVGPRYEAGEIAHVENVMATEERERVHEESTVTEETTRREEQTTTAEKEDLQTTRRSEIKNETEKVIAEQWGIETGVNVSAKYGPVSVDANFGYSRQESKEKSERTAVETSQEITKQATRRVEKQVTEETIRRIREEITERNRHAFDNDTGEHVTGIYRWLDKTYRMDVHEYDDPRLMFEFLVPDPAAGYRYAQRAKPKTKAARKPVEPRAVRFRDEEYWTEDVDEGVEREDGEPMYLDRLSYDDITPTNYRWYATHYGAEDVPEPPAEFRYETTRLTQQESGGRSYEDSKSKRDFTDFGKHNTKHIDVPDGYEVSRVRIVSDTMYRLNRSIAATVRVSAGAQPSERIQHIPYGDKSDKAEPPEWLTFVFKGSAYGPNYVNVSHRDDNDYDRLPVSVMARNVDDYNVVALARLERTEERFREWKADVYESIHRAYEERRREYESEVEAARIGQGVAIEGRNPKKNRQIERTELKRGAIELLEGEALDYDAVTTPSEGDVAFPEMGDLGDLRRDVQFFEQAFEWTEGTYVFYPYYWADPGTWVERVNRTNTDPKFETFLTSGAARFVVPVRPGFESNVLLFMQTGVPFLREGSIDDVNDSRYVDIVSELRERDGAKPGSSYTGNHWFDTVPTSLVKLQASDALPDLVTPVEVLYPDYSPGEGESEGASEEAATASATAESATAATDLSAANAMMDGGWGSPTERPEEE